MGRRAVIAGVGTYLPERVLTNFDLEKMVDTSDEWIRTRTGIRERRIAADHEASSDLGYQAARTALEAARVDPKEVELILCATVHPDMLFPPTACLIQDRLGARRAGAFDLAAECSGFLYGVHLGRHLIESGAHRTVLVVGAEVLSRIVDYKDRSTCVLLGDGAGAVVLRAEEGDRGVLSSVVHADGSGANLLYVPAGGSRLPASHRTVEEGLHYFRMNGPETFRYAIRYMTEATEEALAQAGLTVQDVDVFIPHQANVRIIQAVAERLGLPEEKVVVNIERYGNMSAATIPVALHEALAAGRVQPGHIVVMAAFGAGLTWAGTVLRW